MRAGRPPALAAGRWCRRWVSPGWPSRCTSWASSRLAARAEQSRQANLVIAATVIAVLVTWDIIWILPLPLGVAGHEGSTVVVGLNGLRLLRAAAWCHAGAGSLPRPRVLAPSRVHESAPAGCV